MRKSLGFLVFVVLLVACQPSHSSPTPETVSSPGHPSAVSGELTGALQADVQLDKGEYLPGDQIDVMVVSTTLTESAWVGIVAASTPRGQKDVNDKAGIARHSVASNLGFFMAAPRSPGDYEVRLIEDAQSGKEVASRAFKVKEDPNPVKQAKFVWSPTEPLKARSEIEIAFESPLDISPSAWIQIVPSSTPHGKGERAGELDLFDIQLEGRSRGRAFFLLPGQPGDYDVRMYDNDTEANEVASVSFKILP